MQLLIYLSNVKKRPGMYMANGTCLRDLELMSWGYEAALHSHQIQNDIRRFNREFNDYVREKTRWSTSCGWADAIMENSSSPDLAVEKFFNLANDFILTTKGIEEGINETNT